MNSIFSPKNIGKLEIANRIVMPAMTTNFADSSGHVTEKMISYYQARAKGGVGLIIVEPASVELRGKRLPFNLAIFNDEFIPGLAELAKVIKLEGSRAFLQINHGGRECSNSITGMKPIAPSALPSTYSGIKKTGEEPDTLTAAMIEGLEVSFAKAALRAKQAGFDGIEIHGAHGYLISQFCSPNSNFRTDMYGGNLEGRALFYQNVIRRCKETTGADFSIIARINAIDYVEGGLELGESLRIAALLEKAGADAIHVSVGTHASRPYMMIPGMHVPRGCNLGQSKELKKTLNIPVICVGRINHPDIAEYALSSSSADFVAMGRALIADPDLPRKMAMESTPIRRCIACNEGCINRIHKGLPMSCSINPTVGLETEHQLSFNKAPDNTNILIIGAGPAGLEAARMSAARGCKVSLWEQENELSGQLKLASIPPGRSELLNIMEYYEPELKTLKIDVTLGQAFSLDSIKNMPPDAIILATGASPSELPIPGMQMNSVSAWKVLSGEVKEIKSPCVIIGAGPVGLETAEWLAEKGHSVVILDSRDWKTLVNSYPRSESVFHEMQLEILKIELHTGVEVTKVTTDTVFYVKNSIPRSLLGIGTIITAIGSTSVTTLENSLRELSIPLYKVGDCTSPGKIIDAIHSGYQAAIKL